MWSKLLQAIVMPLLKDAVASLVKWIKDTFMEWQRKRKLKKENDLKIKKYKESETDEEITDNFNNLP